MGISTINGIKYDNENFQPIKINKTMKGLKASNGMVIDFKRTTRYKNAHVKYDNSTQELTISGLNNKKNTINITGTSKDDKVIIEDSHVNNVCLKQGDDKLIVRNSVVTNIYMGEKSTENGDYLQIENSKNENTSTIKANDIFILESNLSNTQITSSGQLDIVDSNISSSTIKADDIKVNNSILSNNSWNNYEPNETEKENTMTLKDVQIINNNVKDSKRNIEIFGNTYINIMNCIVNKFKLQPFEDKE